jgi:predicted  nucleic acid-binding Zn-ribbon protein
MLPVIENLLILQDRDKKIARVEAELGNIEPERAAIERRAKDSQTALETAKTRVKHLESERKKLELDVEAKKGLIEKYSLQQFQTKKNEEYRALAHEIEMCREAIIKLDDEQIVFMEQIETAQKEAHAAAAFSTVTVKQIEDQKNALAHKELRLKKELEELKADYDRLEDAVDESVLERYMRIRRQKGASTVVGIEHSVCGGCHMKLPVQIVLQCQAQQEIVSCPNCGRILYFTREMDLVAAS